MSAHVGVPLEGWANGPTAARLVTGSMGGPQLPMVHRGPCGKGPSQLVLCLGSPEEHCGSPMRAARPRTRERREAVFSRPGMGFLPFGQPPCQKKGARLRAVAKCGLPLTRVSDKTSEELQCPCGVFCVDPPVAKNWYPLAERRIWSRVQIPPRAVQLAPRVPNSTWGAPPTRGRAATLWVTWRFGRRGQMVPGRRHARSSRRALAAAAPRKGFPRQN